jgi:hypothetical protein
MYSKKESAYRTLVGNPRERDHLKYPDEDNIKMYIQEMGWEHGLD